MADKKEIVIRIEGGVGGGTSGTSGGTTKSQSTKSNVFALLEEAKATESLTEKKKLLKQAITLLSKEGSKFEGTIKSLKGAIGQLDKEIVKSKNTWSNALGSYQFKFNALGNIISNVVSTATRMLTQLGSSVVTISKDFEFAMSGVRAITMATDAEFKALSNDAIRLGGSTIYTAQQIAGLQEELAKLGFTVPEIRAATDGVVALAAATGEDLSQSALVAGTVVRGFGLAAGDLTRVVDVMSQSFNDSALDLYKFQETMKYVAPIASKVGFSLEETTALMSKLADQGIVASQAGTGLRNIMLRLADANSNLSKAMGGPVRSLPELIYGLKQLKKEGIDATGALKLVDRYSVTAFLGLIQSSDKLWATFEKLNDSFGVAQKMSEIRMDNFAGSVEKLSGAWDSFILTVNKGNGVLRTAVDVIRKIVEGATKLFQSYEQAATIAANERLIEYRRTIDKTIQETNRGYGEYIKLLNSQLEKELITRKDYSDQIEYIKKQQAIETNDTTNRLLEEQLKKEQEALPQLKRIYESKKEIFDRPYSVINELDKQRSVDELARAEANLKAQENQINDITSLIQQNAIERVGLLVDYADIESGVIEESKTKWWELEKTKIEAMREGVEKDVALMKYGFKEEIANAEHHKLSLDNIFENMKKKENEIRKKYRDDDFAKEQERLGKLADITDSEFELKKNEAHNTYKERLYWIKENIADENQANQLRKSALIKFGMDMANIRNKQMEEEAKAEQEINDEITDTIATRMNIAINKKLQPKLKKDEKVQSLWDAFGLNSEQQQSLKKGFDFITDELQKIADKEVEIADRRVESSERVVDQIQQDLQTEIQLAEAGFASNVSLKQRELEEAKKQQAKALMLQQQALEKQRKVETAMQAINLVSTSAQMLYDAEKATKNPVAALILAGVSIAAMWTMFGIAQSKAKEATKYGEGGEVGGNKHSQGGTLIEAERGEFVVKANSYAKHADLVQAINNDNLNQIYGALNKDLSVSLDDSGTAKMLNKHFGKKQTTYGNGYRIEQVGNRIRKIKYA